ncbi:Major allergen Pru ar 1 [Morella rubra]|uniref:Major allergen Pru ar 1 n=1 Tax=Morella rubra TaxID=262757 RepID=A0A6A1VSK5_9ROSI|nr:Major allergen Pru ar 1 [Morella rubra]KAB1215914.1 Major allergen Pru ar 1 [Morella rubra]
MGCFTYEIDTTSVIPPAKLFKAFVLDADNLIPKVAPQAIKACETIEGNGGPGTIKKITFGEGSQFKYVKHRIDEVDHANFAYGYSVIEGDALSDTLEKISYEIKIVASPDGGSVLKNTSKYHTKGDLEIKEDHIKAGKEKAAGLFKAVESYLLAHPEEYN